jgi:hypothetical protein
MEKKHGKTQYDMERSKSCTDGIGLKVQTMEHEEEEGGGGEEEEKEEEKEEEEKEEEKEEE